MIDIVGRYIELAVSIFVYVTCTTLTVALLVVANTPIIVQGSDKTFIESTGIQEFEESDLYGHDLLLTLLNSDHMAPYPKAIKINDTPVIKLTNEFISHKMSNVGVIYSTSGAHKLSTLLEHKVISEKYVYTGLDAPYVHYILKEVP